MIHFSLLMNQFWYIMCLCTKSLQSCPALYNPIDCSLPGFSVHGILQARIPECVAMPFSSRSSQPKFKLISLCLLHWQQGFLPLASPGKPSDMLLLTKVHTLLRFSVFICVFCFRSLYRFHITLGHHISVDFSWLWQFLTFSLFLMALTFLRSISQLLVGCPFFGIC